MPRSPSMDAAHAPRGMHPALLVTLALAVALLAGHPAAAQDDAGGQDLVLSLDPAGEVTTDGRTDLIEATDHEPGTSYAWTLNLTDDYTVIELRVDQTFTIDRPTQAVPLADDKHFVGLKNLDVTDVDQPARVYNLTGDGQRFTYRLGLPGANTTELTLHLDTQPPGFAIGEVQRVEHNRFFLETNTTERALATLFTQAPGGDPVPRPTPTPALLQRFPVVGLEANTTYDVWLTFEDWSGNNVTSDTFQVTTKPEPELPAPEILTVQPAPNATLSPREVVVLVGFQSLESPVTADGVRLFFDKREVRQGLEVEPGSVTYRPEAPLEPRVYSVSVEITNQAGGTAVERWSFTVQGAHEAPAPGVLVTGLVILALAALRYRVRAH